MGRTKTSAVPIRLRKGSRVYQCVVRDLHGRRRWLSTHQRDPRAAEAAALQIQLRCAAGQAEETTAKAPTLRGGLATLIASLERAKRSKHTIKYRANHGRNLLDFFGADFRLDKVDREPLRKYADARLLELVTEPKFDKSGKLLKEGRPITRHTVVKELGTLRQTIRECGLSWNPKWMPNFGEYYKPKERVLAPEEYPRLLEALGYREYYVRMWVHTGLRESELYGIEREDVDLRGRRFRVRGTKTENADRWIPANDEAIEILKDRLHRHGRLFPVWENAGRDLKAACRRAGIEPVTPNVLRASCATALAYAGKHPKAVANLLGHKSTRMVDRVYTRLGLDIQHDAVSALPDLFKKTDTAGDTQSERISPLALPLHSRKT